MKSFIFAVLGFFVLVIFGGLIVFSVISGTYNNFVSQKNEVAKQQAQIETQMQRRYDLVPNLVGAVKGALQQERVVFKSIADARAALSGVQKADSDLSTAKQQIDQTPQQSSEKVDALNAYNSALGRLLVIVENYPDLKSINTIDNLMSQVEGTENRIAVARERYNESVQTYNTSVQTFPSNLIAGWFGFKTLPSFQSVEDAKKAVPVNLQLGE